MTLIEGEQIRYARWLVVRSALSLELKGLKRRGRSARILANDITDINCRSARDAYIALNTKIMLHLGVQFDRPLPDGKENGRVQSPEET